jgi:hypothetical protein
MQLAFGLPFHNYVERPLVICMSWELWRQKVVKFLVCGWSLSVAWVILFERLLLPQVLGKNGDSM